MKTSLILCLALLITSTACFAGPDSEKIAGDLVEASGLKASLEENFLSSIKPRIEQVKKSGGDDALVNELLDVAKKFYEDNFHWALAKPQIAKAYADELSDEDMKAITAFFQSPAGQVVANKLPLVTRKGTESIMASMQARMPDLQAAMLAVVKKRVDAGTIKAK